MEKRIKRLTNLFLIGIICLHILLSLIPLEIDPEETSKVETNGETYFVISPDGTLVGWGGDDYRLVASGSLLIYPYIARKTILKDVVSVDIGYHCAMAVDKNGILWGWGSIASLLLQEKLSAFSGPIQVMDEVAAVGVGQCCVAAVKTDGSLWMWGSNGADKEIPEPQEIMQDVKSVYVCGKTTFAIRTNNDLYVFTYSDGALEAPPTLTATGIQAVSYLGFNGKYQFLTTDGKVFLSFKDDDDDKTSSAAGISQAAVADHVRAVYYRGVLKDDDSFWLWENENGEAVLIKERENVAYVANSANSNLVVTKDGTIYAEALLDGWPTIPQSMRTVSPVLRNLFILIIIVKVILNRYFYYKRKKAA